MTNKKTEQSEKYKIIAAPVGQFLVCSVPRGEYGKTTPLAIGEPYGLLNLARCTALRFEQETYSTNKNKSSSIGELEFLILDEFGYRRF